MISTSSDGRFSATLASNGWNVAVSSCSSFCEAGCGCVAMVNYSVKKCGVYGLCVGGLARRPHYAWTAGALACAYGLAPPVCFPVFKSTSNATSLSAIASQPWPSSLSPSISVIVSPSQLSRSVVQATPELPTAVIDVNPANSSNPCCGSTRRSTTGRCSTRSHCPGSPALTKYAYPPTTAQT